ncbi:hypothetical protein [Ligilactobacillus ceti]|uniref:hypothetical protein n=1 Tax=Ligilactobacillus ceti TaxID=395085 RepID=UPI0004881110|nr:hypothetical protein [Ligilactobacillus ceti]
MEDKERIDVHYTKWDIFFYFICSVYFLTENNLIGLLGKISLALIFIVSPILFLVSLIKKFNSLDKYAQKTFHAGMALFGLGVFLVVVMLMWQSISMII